MTLINRVGKEPKKRGHFKKIKFRAGTPWTLKGQFLPIKKHAKNSFFTMKKSNENFPISERENREKQKEKRNVKKSNENFPICEKEKQKEKGNVKKSNENFPISESNKQQSFNDWLKP